MFYEKGNPPINKEFRRYQYQNVTDEIECAQPEK